jgi:hypothetical protein
MRVRETLIEVLLAAWGDLSMLLLPNGRSGNGLCKAWLRSGGLRLPGLQAYFCMP